MTNIDIVLEYLVNNIQDSFCDDCLDNGAEDDIEDGVEVRK